MRTTAEENERMGAWIGERLNRMEGPVRFLIPEGGVSLLDQPGGAFHDPAADAALFEALRSDGAPDAAPAPDPAALQHQRSRLRRGAGEELPRDRSKRQERDMPRIRTQGPAREIPRHDRARRADHRRRRRHGPFGQMRGGRRHRSHRHLQFRPLPHGGPRLARRAAGLWQCQRDRASRWRARCCRW